MTEKGLVRVIATPDLIRGKQSAVSMLLIRKWNLAEL
jgi:hypothetical protein